MATTEPRPTDESDKAFYRATEGAWPPASPRRVTKRSLDEEDPEVRRC